MPFLLSFTSCNVKPLISNFVFKTFFFTAFVTAFIPALEGGDGPGVVVVAGAAELVVVEKPGDGSGTGDGLGDVREHDASCGASENMN